MTAILALENVTFAYGRKAPAVLENLSLEFEGGVATAILGPNGAGKSTLLHVALGWLRPRSGRVLLDGRPLGSLPRRTLGRSMALVPQAERTPFDYTVLDYVLLARAPYLAPLATPSAEDERLALDAIREVGLGGFVHRAITTLSGGERQNVLLARALAQRPRLLLMDEPTTHLDLGHKARLVGLLRERIAAGTTVILTTHEPDLASALASRVVLVRDGTVLRSGPLAEVFTEQNLGEAYGVPVRMAWVDGRQVVTWR